MSLFTFSEKVKSYLKAAGCSQKVLANTLGLQHTVLSHKLNGTGRTILTHPEIKEIVKALAKLEAISTRLEACELLREIECPPFSHQDWGNSPLRELEAADFYALYPTGTPAKSSSVLHTAMIAPFESNSSLQHSENDTVTFLFADFERGPAPGALPAAVKKALAGHGAVLRQAIEGNGGQIFKQLEISYYAAFPTATAALAAALAAQRTFERNGWRWETGKVPWRIAIHTGNAGYSDDAYFGLPLSRTACLLSAGHSGQILLTLASAELVRDQLPEEISLWDLGEYRLKDLERPGRIFQVVGPGLLAEFLPLAAPEIHPAPLSF